MSPAVTSFAPLTLSVSTFGSSVFSLTGKPLRLSSKSTVSSTTPGIVENSCSTPSIFTYVTAAPGIDESSMRRSALPSVIPKPRSSGSITNLA